MSNRPEGGIVRAILKVSGCLVAALLLAIPQVSGAAGLGRLTVLSSMGEPFHAEIDLLAYREEWSARPRMAPADDYKLANFSYSPALNGARLLIRKHANGRDYIEVMSPRAVSEPFVYLLIELDWNGSRLVRAYTALLDPPGYGSQRAVAMPLPVPELRTIPAAPAGLAPRPAAAATALPALPGTSVPPLRRDPIAAITAPAVDPLLAGRIGQLEKQVSAGAKTLSGLLDRVAVMEEQVQRLQRMIEAQNARAAAAPKPAAMPPAANVATAPKAAVAAAPAVQAPAASPAVPAQPVPAQPAPAQLPPAVSPQAAPPQVAPQPAPVASPPPPAAPKVVAVPAPVEAQPPLPAPYRGDSLVNEALLVLVGGSLILAGWLMYLMWGRKRKPGISTEDILVKMLARDPERDDVQLKLLEIYAGRGDKTAYQNMAIKLHKVTGGQGDTWHRAAATGYALDPGNPLYADGRYAVMATSAGDAHAVRH